MSRDTTDLPLDIEGQGRIMTVLVLTDAPEPHSRRSPSDFDVLLSKLDRMDRFGK